MVLQSSLVTPTLWTSMRRWQRFVLPLLCCTALIMLLCQHRDLCGWWMWLLPNQTQTQQHSLFIQYFQVGWLIRLEAFTVPSADPTAGLLSINPATGAVYIQGPLDVAISPQYVIIVQVCVCWAVAHDVWCGLVPPPPQATLNISSPFNEYFCSSVYRSYAAVRVFVKETINKPPLCLHDLYFFELPENTAVGSLVGTNIGAIDFDQVCAN